MDDPFERARAQRNWRDAKAREREAADSPEGADEELDDVHRDEAEKRRQMFGADPRPTPEAEDTPG